MIGTLLLLLDPFFVLMALVAVSLGFSKAYIIPVTSVFVGLFAETLAMKVTPGHNWGDSFSIISHSAHRPYGFSGRYVQRARDR